MSNDPFDVKVLAEKLSKLNNSQQSIESLSRWCIPHRKKARQVVETWDKSFNSSQKDQCVSFLYLANDILQNSRRKGSEFVNEFWKVLPAALKHVHENGDDNGRKTVSRLVNIWEERKVFGSRGQNLKQELLRNDPPPQSIPQSVNNGKISNPVKIVKKDAQAIRFKLPVGDVVEKIVTAFHNFHDQGSTEEAAIMRSNEVVLSLEKLEKNVENASVHGLHLGPEVVDQLQDQESVLVNCIEQLERAESTRVTLVSQLKEALVDHEKQLEMLRSQLRVAGSRINSLEYLRQKLSSQHHHDLSAAISKDPSADLSRAMESSNHAPVSLQQSNGPQVSLGQLPASSVQLPSSLPSLQPPLIEPAMSFVTLGGGGPAVTDEEKKRAVAAAVAAKLSASASSAQMLTSVLSSLVAEEAAMSMNKSGLTPPEKRQKVENLSSSSAGNNTVLSSEAGGGNNTYYNPHFMPTTTSLPQSISHPPLPPLQHPGNFMPSSGMMLPVVPFSYGSGSLPPPPPPPPLAMPSNVTMGMTRPSTQQQASPPPGNQQQQQPGSGYYRPTSMGMYGQNQQAMAPPPVNLQ